MKQEKSVVLIDLLNDLERSENIRQRIEHQLKQSVDRSKQFDINRRNMIGVSFSSVSTFMTIPIRPF